MPSIQELIQELIIAESQAETIAIKVRELRDQISSIDFEKVSTDTHTVTKAVRKSYTIRKDAIIPDEYKTTVFDMSAMIKKEPSTRSRITKGLLSEYPEYSTDQVDDTRLKQDHIELYDEKATPYITIKKI